MKDLSENSFFVAVFLTCMIYAPIYIPYFTRNELDKLEMMDIIVPLLFFVIIYTAINSLKKIENEKGKN